MNRFASIVVSVLILVAISSVACSKRSTVSDSSLIADPNQYVILGDRSDPYRERIYVFSDEQIFISDHIFPGYTDRRHFVLDSSKLKIEAAWDQFDELQPPFVPSGPTGYCFIYDGSGNEQQAMYFDAINGASSTLMNGIDWQTRKHAAAVEEIPEWVEQQSEVFRRIGF